MELGRRIYFDYAATTPLREGARRALVEALDIYGNASSVHAEGQRARALLDDARRTVAGCLGVRAERVVFTSGGTEANNLALRGMVEGFRVSGSQALRKKVLVSAVEHDCVLDTGKVLGAEVIPVDGNGVVDLAWLQERLGKGDVGLVSVMLANNETGVIQPVREVAGLAKMHGALVHCDAVQAVGHVDVDVDGLGVDMLALTGHKFGGPKGAGALVVKPEVKMVAQITGGAQERNRRGGTENIAAIAGMAAALAEAIEGMDAEAARARAIGAELRNGIRDSGFGVRIEEVAAGVEKVPHVLQLRTPGKKGEDVVIAMDMRGVAVSQGSACSSGRVQSSHVLRAMGFDDTAAGEGLRLSWGWGSTVAEAEVVLAALRGVL